MGYVGVSLASVLADAGLRVHGVDINKRRVSQINNNQCPIEEKTVTRLFKKYTQKNLITATDSHSVIEDCSVIVITVGTPLVESDPDTSAVETATSSIGPHLENGDLVIYRSTLPAGTTEETLRPILDESSGLAAGEDYALAFCPERMAEGSAYHDLTSIPVVGGGYTDSCQKRVEQFWQQVNQETVAVSSPTAAELSKLADNLWIDLNIALANEIALLSEELGANAMEVIEAANSLPKGDNKVNILYPGSGVGGSCLLKDPWFVVNLGDKFDLDLQTPRVSRRVNNQMPKHMINLLTDVLSDIDDVTVAVLGYSFKAGTDDTRNTPTKEIVEDLSESGANVTITDPFVSSAKILKEVGIEPLRLPEALHETDAIIIVTGHEQYQSLDADDLISYVGSDEFTVVDGRFTFDPEDFTDTPITYRGVGRGDIDE
jgi:UDP-N-acetyl-D-mannosaminuronic acid dehydrogenase